MTVPIDRSRLLAIFQEELEGRRRALEQGLVELEGAPATQRREELLRELFRAAHSLKGAALSVGAPAVAAVARELEQAFEDLRATDASELAVAPLLEAVDRLARAADVDAPPEDAPGDHGSDPDSSGGAAPGPSAPVTTDRPPPADGSLPGRAHVSVAELEAAITSAGQLQLAIHDTEELADEAAACATTLRRLRTELGDAHHGAVPAGGRRAASSVDRAGNDQLVQALIEVERRLGHLERRTGEVQQRLVRSGSEVTQTVQALSMVRFDEVCVGLDRAVRDVSVQSGKRSRLEVASGALELDRAVAAALRDPLLHLVRNAVDHGIETPAARERVGKSPVGRVRVAARVRSGRLVVAVTDDGAGIGLGGVRTAAERTGIDPPSDPEELLQLVFSPGLSTSPDVTDVSGRGVGLDAVRADVEAVGGTAEIASASGHGTTVTLTLPLTLSTMGVFTAELGPETVALPTTAIRGVVRVDPDDLIDVGARRGIVHDDRPVPIIDLAAALGFPSTSLRDDDRSVVVVVDVPGGQAGLSVDAALDQDEVTLRSLGPRLADIPGVLGAATLPDARLVFVLNPATWVRQALESPTPAEPEVSDDEAAHAPHVLLAEDTLTTRTLERSILEAAGYVVTAAADGAEAWERLQRHGADLVVADVDMPNMDGFSLCESIRSSPRFADIPVVLVTSLADEQHRARGAEVGANAYFVKSDFDQRTLLDTIRRLL